MTARESQSTREMLVKQKAIGQARKEIMLRHVRHVQRYGVRPGHRCVVCVDRGPRGSIRSDCDGSLSTACEGSGEAVGQVANEFRIPKGIPLAFRRDEKRSN